eukprot:140516-Chlamydomonas_euryale.AAC.2
MLGMGRLRTMHMRSDVPFVTAPSSLYLAALNTGISLVGLCNSDSDLYDAALVVQQHFSCCTQAGQQLLTARGCLVWGHSRVFHSIIQPIVTCIQQWRVPYCHAHSVIWAP